MKNRIIAALGAVTLLLAFSVSSFAANDQVPGISNYVIYPASTATPTPEVTTPRPTPTIGTVPTPTPDAPTKTIPPTDTE